MKTHLGTPAVLAVLCLAGCGGKEAPPPEFPKAPRIVVFEASKSELQLGESVTLSYTVENATEVQVVDQTGVELDVTGDAASGEVAVTPTETSFFVLRARGEGGRATDFEQVAVGEDLKEVFLIAVPPVIDGGAESQLLWSAHRSRTAKVQTSAGQEIPLAAAQGAGILDVTPARTLAYTLVASGVDASKSLTATAEIKVRPVVKRFTLKPSAARAGEALVLHWETAGANQISITEATFGEVGGASGPGQLGQVDDGELSWTVPTTLPGGEPVIDGHPLRFTLTATSVNPALTVTRTRDSYVGDGPQILSFQSPVAVTEGRPASFSWRTFNATRVVLLADGHPIYEPLPSQADLITEGTYTVAMPAHDVVFELRAYSHLGGETSEVRTVAVVAAPQITSFVMPQAISHVGAQAQAIWTTQNATSVVLRVKQGPAVYRSVMTAAAGTTEVYPGAGTTFVLEAYNDAGEKATAEQQVAVITPGIVTASPTPSLAGDQISFQWELDSGLVSGVYGLPNAPVVPSNPSTEWLDLNLHTDAKALVFANPDDALEAVPLPQTFFFPLAGSLNHRYFVSTNGFVRFNPGSSLPVNVTLEDPGEVPMMVAPFWSNLQLGANGRVLWVVEGEEFPRRLIIQWDKVQIAGDDQSELTFQVQLYENGKMTLAYGDLVGSQAFGDDASIGYRLNATLAKELASTGAAVLNPGDQFVFFSGGPLMGELLYAPQKVGAFTLFAPRPAGGWYVFPAKVNPLTPGDFRVNEVMVLPDVSALAGRWIEFANLTDEDIDLAGTVLTSISAGSDWTVPEGAIIPANGFLVVGESVDLQVNGEAPVDLEWSGFAPSTSGDDTLVVTVNGITLDSLAYVGTQLQPGKSIQATDEAIDGSGNPLFCSGTETYGSNGAVGTPGQLNEACFEYALQSIPGAWENLYDSPGATFIYQSTASGFSQATLPEPFTYFGNTYTEFSVSSAGFLTFGNVLTEHGLPSTCTGSGTCNHTAPGGAGPHGVIAPFWDEILGQSANATLGLKTASITMERKAGYTVVAWDNYRIWGETASRLFFQVKLFDTGVIEFHYGPLVAPSGAAKADFHTGTSATIWIERPDGSGALPIGINEAGTVQANSGYRFIPTK